MHSKAMFFEKFKEAAASVLPITLIVALMCLSFVPVTADLLLAFLLGQCCWWWAWACSRWAAMYP